ncbi:hypothetical protein GJAV_G00011110 [Gymnothorax javanicus]|nr:hypothetical protein GJAV_G00011110 [Gymnothorax javanicus]
MNSFMFSFKSIYLKYSRYLLISRSLIPVNKIDSRLFRLLGPPTASNLSSKEQMRFIRGYKKESSVYSRSVFAAGTAKRTTELMKSKLRGVESQLQQEHEERCRDFELPDHPLTAVEWKKLKENDRKPDRFEIRMIVTMLSTGAHINVAKSLLAFVALETGTLPYELLLKYLALCVQRNHLSEVFDVYDIMKSRFKALDAGACSLFIKGFSGTERWREALPFLENLKKQTVPSPRNYGDVIDGAVRHGDMETAWTLHSEILDKGMVPTQATWQSLFDSGLSDPNHAERCQSILFYMRDNQIYPNKSLTKSIKAWFERLPGDMWKGNWSHVAPSAVCQSCQAKLESIQLSEEEYGQLKDQVMKDIIKGRDVFTKTTPEELESFKAFVKRKPAFDVVVDGLNVANVSVKGCQSETLLAVVSALEQQGLRILVLGRKHMLRHTRSWDRHHMSLIQKKAHCFFTDNISEDDPFLLYAALHSGNHCVFVSRDLMRDHKACLPSTALRRLFFKWQRGHQLVLENDSPGRKVCFQRIHSHDTIIQTDTSSWHIPYDEDGEDRCSYEVPQKWLCLTRVD